MTKPIMRIRQETCLLQGQVTGSEGLIALMYGRHNMMLQFRKLLTLPQGLEPETFDLSRTMHNLALQGNHCYPEQGIADRSSLLRHESDPCMFFPT